MGALVALSVWIWPPLAAGVLILWVGLRRQEPVTVTISHLYEWEEFRTAQADDPRRKRNERLRRIERLEQVDGRTAAEAAAYKAKAAELRRSL